MEGLVEAVLEAEGGDGGAPGVSAVAGAIVGVEALGGAAVLLQESEGGVEKGDGTAGGFVREELGESEARVIIHGDVEELPAGPPRVIVLTIAGDAVARAHDASEFL